MTIFNKISTSLLIGLLLSAFACQKGVKKDEILNPDLDFRPNILWLVAEDLSPYIPAFGDSTVVTPALDRLAREGVCYDNFFSPHPVCAPARASIITGMYANSISASHMRTGPWMIDNLPQNILDIMRPNWPEGINFYEAIPAPEVKMFTEYMRAAGYFCTNNAKEDYQFRKTMTSWDEWGREAHWRNRPPGKPFFSVFNFEVTHESQIWGKANDSLWVQQDLNVPIPPYLPDTEIAKKDIRRMYSNIMEMDAQVGKVLEELASDGLLDSTIVVWYTDHGGPLPRQKRLLFDSGLKVPMIVRFPNSQFSGKRDGRMISFIDLAPTMISLAGVEPGSYMDGSAFLGQYVRKQEPQYVFGAADRFDAVTDHVRSVRDERYKYIRYFEPDKPMFLNVAYRNQMPIMQELLRLRSIDSLSPAQSLWFRENKPKEELFDTEKDPHEINNLAENPEYNEILVRMRKACDNWISEIHDTGLKPETELLRELWPDGIQPTTATPEMIPENGNITIQCSTEGASIGYKWIADGEDPISGPWEVYTSPIAARKGQKLIAVAHRIGYLRSKENQLNIGM